MTWSHAYGDVVLEIAYFILFFLSDSLSGMLSHAARGSLTFSGRKAARSGPWWPKTLNLCMRVSWQNRCYGTYWRHLGRKARSFNGEPVLGPTSGLDVGRRSREGRGRRKSRKRRLSPCVTGRLLLPVLGPDARNMCAMRLRKSSQGLPVGSMSAGARGKAGKASKTSKTSPSSMRHRHSTFAGSRSLREKHVCDAFKKDVSGPTDRLETGRCARKGREGVRNAKNVAFVRASGEAFLLVTAHSKRLFRAGKGWRGPPQHVRACGHRFPPLGPTGTTRAGEREGMSSLCDNW